MATIHGFRKGTETNETVLQTLGKELSESARAEVLHAIDKALGLDEPRPSFVERVRSDWSEN